MFTLAGRAATVNRMFTLYVLNTSPRFPFISSTYISIRCNLSFSLTFISLLRGSALIKNIACANFSGSYKIMLKIIPLTGASWPSQPILIICWYMGGMKPLFGNILIG